MTAVINDLPDLIVAKEAFGSGHTGGCDAVVDDPLELTIGIPLNGRRRQQQRIFLANGIKEGFPGLL
jgi:hypothetical protein